MGRERRLAQPEEDGGLRGAEEGAGSLLDKAWDLPVVPVRALISAKRESWKCSW